ncbi:MAG: putative toxin-antitoxin system toxin component, PIN family [Pseudomonadota bacterium]
MKLVIDTNVYVSAALFPQSSIREMVNRCIHNHDIFFSRKTFEELTTVFARSSFDRFASPNARYTFLDTMLESNLHFVRPERPVSASIDDSDNRFLEVAVACQAAYLITGDKKHLLPLHPFEGTSIVTPRDFIMCNGQEFSYY